jgi:MoaA/NifB/PqqE/SkfB family radical SAM enzyme
MKNKLNNILYKLKYSNLPREPVQIDIAITKECCLKCQFCDCWKRKKEENEVTIDEWEKFLSEVKEWTKIKFLCIGGGEPFMKKGLTDLLRFCAEKDILTVVITNGYLMNDKLIKEVIDSGLQKINFSLDGTEKTHDKLRGKKGVFKKVNYVIDKFKELKPEMPIELSTMINNANFKELPKFVEWIQKNKNIDSVNFQAIQRVVRYDGPEWYKKEKLWPKDLKKINEIIDKLIYLKKKGYKINNPTSQFKMFKKYFENPENTDNLYCKAGFSSIPVDCKGNVLLCQKQAPIGNILEKNIRKMYYNRKSKNIRKKSKNCNEKCHFLINCYYDER